MDNGKYKLLIGAAVLLCVFSSAAIGANVRVGAAASDEVYVGEPFTYQVILEGCSEAGDVDIGPLKQFSPQSRGGQNLSSSYTTIINGKTTVNNQSKYVMVYQLVTPKAGKQVIPPVKVTINGQTYTTNAVPINAVTPGKTDKLTLDASFSADSCYVGEPITMTCKWYIAVNIVDHHINIPFLDDDNFSVEDLAEPPGKGGKLIQLKLGSSVIIARQNVRRRQGNQLPVITFGKILIPLRAGEFQLPAPTITCNVEVNRQPGPFGRRQYRRFIVKGKQLNLAVKPLPAAGRPANFNNLVGRYGISTSASPTQNVYMGDPITLTINITGGLLKHVQMPDLKILADDFKFPIEHSAGKIQGSVKTFTRTIRPMKSSDDGLTEIPPIGLSYFDVDKGKYITAYSEPIKLEVKAKKVVTSEQLEGHVPVVSRQVSEIEKTQRGISANYEGADLLLDADFSPEATLAGPIGIAFWIGPMMLFVVAGLLRALTHDSPARQLARRKNRACKTAVSQLSRLSDGEDTNKTAEIMRQYIGDRFGKTTQSLTVSDCGEILADNCGRTELAEEFCRTLEQCQQSRFAGGFAGDSSVSGAKVAELVKTIEKELR